MTQPTLIKGTHTGAKIKVEIETIENAITLVQRCRQMQESRLKGVTIVSSNDRIDKRYVQALEESLNVPPVNAYAMAMTDDEPTLVTNTDEPTPYFEVALLESEPFTEISLADDDDTTSASIADFGLAASEDDFIGTLEAIAHESEIEHAKQDPQTDEDDMLMPFLDNFEIDLIKSLAEASAQPPAQMAYNLKDEPFESDFLGRSQDEIENDQFALQQEFQATVHFLDDYVQNRFAYKRSLHDFKDERLFASLLLEKELRRATLSHPFFHKGIEETPANKENIIPDMRNVDAEWHIKNIVTYYPGADYEAVLNMDRKAPFTAPTPDETFNYMTYHKAILSAFETVTRIEMEKAPYLVKFHKILQALNETNNIAETAEHASLHDMRALYLKSDILAGVASEIAKAIRTSDPASIESQFEAQSVFLQYLLQIDVHVLKSVKPTEPFEWFAYIHSIEGDEFAHQLMEQAISHVDIYAKCQAFDMFDYHFQKSF